jgi:hypothetical protein
MAPAARDPFQGDAGFLSNPAEEVMRGVQRSRIRNATPLEIDEHLAVARTGMSDSARHHNCVALERLQKFALQHSLLDKPVFGILEKPRVGLGCRKTWC